MRSKPGAVHSMAPAQAEGTPRPPLARSTPEPLVERSRLRRAGRNTRGLLPVRNRAQPVARHNTRVRAVAS
jgi:hypothetical protein